LLVGSGSGAAVEKPMLWIDAAIVDCAAMTVERVSVLGRCWLAWQCAVRVLSDERFASRVAELHSGAPDDVLPPTLPASSPAMPAPAPAPSASGALQLLSLLQREGRLLDFVEQEVTGFSDAEIAAAARVVHEGCRRALHAHGRVVSVRSEPEGAQLTLERAREDVKLVGNVAGSAPFRGVLRHRGWRVEDLTLPTLLGGRDASLVAQAELEL
jgi:hypothetical protein